MSKVFDLGLTAKGYIYACVKHWGDDYTWYSLELQTSNGTIKAIDFDTLNELSTFCEDYIFED